MIPPTSNPDKRTYLPIGQFIMPLDAMYLAGRPASLFPAVSQPWLEVCQPLAVAAPMVLPASVTGRRLSLRHAPSRALSAVAQMHPCWGRSAVQDTLPAHNMWLTSETLICKISSVMNVEIIQ